MTFPSVSILFYPCLGQVAVMEGGNALLVRLASPNCMLISVLALLFSPL